MSAFDHFHKLKPHGFYLCIILIQHLYAKNIPQSILHALHEN